MSKINQLGKSTIALMILSFLLVAVIAFGGTYAYFSAQDDTSASVTMGHIHLNDATMGDSMIMTQDFAVPNQTIIDSTSQDGTEGHKKIGVTVDSNVAYFIRAIVTAEIEIKYTETEARDHDDNPETPNLIVYHDHTGAELPEDKASTHVLCSCVDKDYDVLNITLPDEDGWKLSDDESVTSNTTSSSIETYTVYKTAKQPAQTSTTETHTLNMKVTVDKAIGKDDSKHFMDAVITITVKFQAVQADYLFEDEDGNGVVAESTYTVTKLADAWAKVYPGA